MKNIPKPLLIVFVLMIAAFICMRSVDYSISVDFDGVVNSLQDVLENTFLGGVPIDLGEILIAKTTASSPNPIRCLNRHERRFIITQEKTCRYMVQGSSAPVRVLELHLEQGNCVEIQLEQNDALPVTLTLLSAEALEDANDDDDTCNEAEEPRLQIFQGEGRMWITCHKSDTENECILMVPE